MLLCPGHWNIGKLKPPVPAPRSPGVLMTGALGATPFMNAPPEDIRPLMVSQALGVLVVLLVPVVFWPQLLVPATLIRPCAGANGLVTFD